MYAGNLKFIGRKNDNKKLLWVRISNKCAGTPHQISGSGYTKLPRGPLISRKILKGISACYER